MRYGGLRQCVSAFFSLSSSLPFPLSTHNFFKLPSFSPTTPFHSSPPFPLFVPIRREYNTNFPSSPLLTAVDLVSPRPFPLSRFALHCPNDPYRGRHSGLAGRDKVDEGAFSSTCLWSSTSSSTLSK
jgi:hypothetical protein